METVQMMPQVEKFREMIFRDWLWYVGCESKHREYAPGEPHWAAMYHHIKHDLKSPIPPWVETKYLMETDFPIYVGCVGRLEIASAKGENPLGIKVTTSYDEDEIRKTVCWARCCLKSWFTQFGLKSDLVRQALGLEVFSAVQQPTSAHVFEKSA